MVSLIVYVLQYTIPQIIFLYYKYKIAMTQWGMVNYRLQSVNLNQTLIKLKSLTNMNRWFTI